MRIKAGNRLFLFDRFLDARQGSDFYYFSNPHKNHLQTLYNLLMENFPKSIDKTLDLWYTIIVPRENEKNKEEVFIMYVIYYRSNGDKYGRKISIIDKDYTISILTHILDCWDLESITVIDGLTGELLYEHFNGITKIYSSDFI